MEYEIDPIRFIEALPAFVVVWFFYLRKLHARIFRSLSTIIKNQRKLAENSGVRIDDTDSFPVVPSNGADPTHPTH